MEVKIGVQNANRELVIDSRESADDVEKAVAKALGLGWDLVNDLAVSETRAMVYDQPGHFDGV